MFSIIKKYTLISILISTPLVAMESNKEETIEKRFYFTAINQLHDRKYSSLQRVIETYLNPEYLFSSSLAKKLIELTTVTLPRDERYGIDEITFSPDSTILASTSRGGTIKLWDTKNAILNNTLEHTNWVNSIAFSPDGTALASGANDNAVKLWDTKNKTLTTALSGNPRYVESVAFSPDGTLLASGSIEGTIELWDLKTKLFTILHDHTDKVYSLAFSPDGKVLASASRDATVKLWDIKNKILITTLSDHNDAVLSVAFSPNGTMFASASCDNTVKLWDTKNNKHITTLSGHNHWATSVAFSPDDTILASGSFDKTIKLWNTKDKTLVTTLYNHIEVESVAFSPDGTMLASAPYLNLWRIPVISTFLKPLSVDKKGLKKFVLLMAIFEHFEATKKPLNLIDPEIITTLKSLPAWLQKPLQDKLMVRVWHKKEKNNHA